MASAFDLIRESGLPRHEAERLLVVAAGSTRAEVMTLPDVGHALGERFGRLVTERKRGVPLQYLEGTVQFGPLELKIDSRALIPRPETEQLWERVVDRLRADPPEVIVDLCTGSGNLALALKHTFRAAMVYGTDIAAAAVDLARENAAFTGLDVAFVEGDLFAPVPDGLRGRVDAVVANPPYVSTEDFCSLPVDVRDHEPAGALVPGRYGDEALVAIAAEAASWLAPGGLVACEIGERQGERAGDLFAAYGAVVERDLAGRDRFVVGRAPAR